MEILIAETAGICFGVERALNLSDKALSEIQGPIQSLGPLIHNPQTVKEFEGRGLKVAEKLEDLDGGTVVFRSHGVTLETQSKARELGLKVVDATCPLVKVPQNFAKKLSQAGYFVVIVGDAKHPEILGVKSYVENGEVAVVKDESEVTALPQKEKVGVICQTTLKRATLDAVVAKLQERYKEVKLHNTICSATKDRQEAAFELAQKVEAVVVIGGKNSSNTHKLFEICEKKAGKAFLVETEDEIDPQWFIGLNRVGITAGASTPHKLIESVRARIDQLTRV